MPKNDILTLAAIDGLFSGTYPDPCRSPTRCAFWSICKTQRKACARFYAYVNTFTPAGLKRLSKIDQTPYSLFYDKLYSGNEGSSIYSIPAALKQAKAQESMQSVA